MYILRGVVIESDLECALEVEDRENEIIQTRMYWNNLRNLLLGDTVLN